MTKEKDDDDTDKDPPQVHLVTRRRVPVSSHVGVFDTLVDDGQTRFLKIYESRNIAPDLK